MGEITHSSDSTAAPTSDDVLDALDDLARVLEENNERNARAIERVRLIRELRAHGLTYREIVTAEERPLVVEMASANHRALSEAGARLRRCEAAALHQEGLTMDRIAEMFGVTRQRVSALIRSRERSE